MPVYRVQSPDGREVELEGDVEPSDSDLDEVFAGLPPKQSRQEMMPAGYQPMPTIIGLESELPSLSPFSFSPQAMPEPRQQVSFEPEPVPPMLTEVPRQLFTPSPLSTERTAIQQEAKAALPIQERVGQIDQLNRAYRERIAAIGDFTGNPEKTALVNALNQQLREATSELGAETIDLMKPPQMERITPQQGRTALQALGVKNPSSRAASALSATQGAVAGAAESFLSPEGAVMMGGPKAIAKPLASAFIGLMAKDAITQTKDAIQLYAEGKTEEADAALINAAAVAGMLGIPLIKAKGPNAAVELAKALEKSEVQPRATVDESAQIRSGLPPRATAEMLPELQRTKELVDAAIQEATQKIVEPGRVSALELLRRQQQEVAPGEVRTQKPDTRFERPAEEVMRGKTVAEKPITEEVIAEPVKVEPKPAEPLPETEAAYAQPNKPEVASRGTGERKDSYGEPTGTRYHASPEDWSVWQDVSAKPLTEPGVWATREAIKNKYGGMPPEAPKIEGAVVKQPPTPQPESAAAASKGPEVQPTSPKASVTPEVTSGKKSLYREASARDVDSYINPSTSARNPFGPLDIFTSTSRDLALGQRSGKSGIIVEINPEGLEVLEPKNKKPGAEFSKSVGGGEEKVIRSQPSDIGKNVKSVFIPDSAPKDAYLGRLKRFLKDNWDTQKTEGGTTYTPKVEASKSDIISKLESLKRKPSEGTQLFSLPHPDAIKAIGKQLWNDSIDVAIAAVKAGRAVKAAIAEAISHIKRNARNYDETQIRANLESVLKDEGLVSKPVKASPPAAEGVAKSDAGIVVPEGQKQRSYSARASVSEKVPTPVQEAIKTDERSSYTPQNVAEVTEGVKGKTDAQLFALTPESPEYTVGRAELAQRAFDRGDNESGLNIVQEASKSLTTAGQIINQAKLLNALKPEQQVLVVNENLKKAGKDPLTEAQTKKALDLARDAKAKQGELDSATEAWKKNPTPENAKLAEDALTKANKAALESQKFNNAFQPRSTALLLKAILQGNLLTQISQTANLVGNMSFLPFRAATRGVAAGMDILQSAATGRKRTSSVGPISGTSEAAKGLVRGVKNIPGILKEGTGNTILGETRQGLHPVKAWMNQFASNPDVATKGGKLGLKERLNLFLEGTLGIPAEIMLRGLGAGDQPFREAAKARITTEQLRLNKVPQENWAMAQKFPELFFDGKTLEAIKEQTDYSVFQRQSKTLNYITKMITSRGNTVDFLAATVAPYKLTPWNIIGEILSYNPVVATARGLHEASKGNRREANMNAGKLVVGTLLTTAAYQLYKNGLLSPSLDSKDETQKERILLGQVMPPNHVNISGLERYLKGGDPAFKPGDKTVDVMRSGGLAGAFMYMTANVGRDLEKNPQGDNWDLMQSILTQSTLEQARFGMNQSFLQGVEGLMSAVKDGNADNYIKSWASTVTSIPIPNTLTALGRATRENKPQLSDPEIGKKIENVLRNKLGITGAAESLPLKRGLWGEPIPETPEGRNPYAYHLFDVSKGQQITDDPKTLEVYRLWRKTDDSSVIPTPPVPKSGKFTFKGKEYILNPKQAEQLEELVGTKRAEIADAIVSNPNWATLSDDGKIKTFQKIYSKGLDYGKSVFYLNNKGSLKEKPQKAGFQTP